MPNLCGVQSERTERLIEKRGQQSNEFSINDNIVTSQNQHPNIRTYGVQCFFGTVCVCCVQWKIKLIEMSFSRF